MVSVMASSLVRPLILERAGLALSAAQQPSGQVELTVHDPSDDRVSEDVVRRWSSACPFWACTYVRTTQRGSCS